MIAGGLDDKQILLNMFGTHYVAHLSTNLVISRLNFYIQAYYVKLIQITPCTYDNQIVGLLWLLTCGLIKTDSRDWKLVFKVDANGKLESLIRLFRI